MQLRELVADVTRGSHDGDGGDDDDGAGGVRLAVVGDATTEVTEAVHDSRSVRAGSLFCCVPGALHDGHDFASAAVDAGAAAVLCDRPLGLGVAEVRTSSVRRAMGPVASTLAGNPSDHLTVVGVTGTNGKTTVTHLLGDIFQAAGWPHEVIGTLSGARTTPEAPELQGRLADCRRAGGVAVAMEVSSHALDLHRVDGTTFAVAVFTNLSQDHLDHHGDLASYFAAKARLFEPERCRLAIVNADDAHGRELEASVGVPVLTYSQGDATDLVLDGDGSSFTWRGHPVRIPLAGRFNVSNALAAATVALAVGIDEPAIAAGLAAARPIAGRFERIHAGQPFVAAVDYAHTPDGLEQLLTAGRELAEGRVLVVFGAGGDRDPQKRPLMGEVADRLADVAILTTDNPRSEDPATISDAVRAGMTGRCDLRVEPDRAAAIALAVGAARRGDVVLVAGKGHETTQITGTASVAFDDREVLRAALAGGGHHATAGAAS